MQVTEYITNKINRFRSGYVFTYDDLDISVDMRWAVTKALSRLVQKNKIRKLSKGRFYKVQFTDFGNLQPEIFQVVKDLLEKDDKIIGYLTGYSVYNQLGLTTQISSTLQIGTNEVKKNIIRGMYRIRFIKQQNIITKENIPLLRVLDSIRYINDIPDTTVDKACTQIMLIIEKYTDKELRTFIKLALKYNPVTRALAGAIVDKVFGTGKAELLIKSLNPSTSYNIGISESALPVKQKWNII